MEITRDEVRVMTVHGAKGLEAPIVILADTTTRPAGPAQRQPRLLTLDGSGAAPGSARSLRLGPRQGDRRRAGRRRARARAARGRGRISAAALRRDDARHRPAGRCAAPKARANGPPGCWWNLVSTRVAAGIGRGAGRRRRRDGVALSQGAAARRQGHPMLTDPIRRRPQTPCPPGSIATRRRADAGSAALAVDGL